MPEVLDAATTLALVVRRRAERARNAAGAAPLRTDPGIGERLRTFKPIVTEEGFGLVVQIEALPAEPRSGQRERLHGAAQD
jgi:hypothetical protein